MKIEQIEQLLKRGETQSVAAIPGKNQSLLLETVCAMANSSGGHIVVGAQKRAYPLGHDNHFQITGVSLNVRSNGFADNLGEQLTPPIEITVERCQIKKHKFAIVVSVGKLEGGERAKMKSGESWVRVDGENMRSPVKGIGEAVVGESFIVGNETDREEAL